MNQLFLINAGKVLPKTDYELLYKHSNVQLIEDEDIVKNMTYEHLKPNTDVFMFFNKESIDFQSILTFIKYTRSNDITIIIDASTFDENDHDALDSVMDILADYVQLLIADDQDDLKKMVIGLISKYL